MFTHGSRIRTSVIGCIYKKTFRLSAQSRQQAEIGNLTNMIAINADMLGDAVFYFNYIWSAPLQVLIASIILWSYLGVSAIIAVIVLVLILPISFYMINSTKKIQLIKQRYMDERIKTMSEILSGIKIIKFYGWELSFEDIVGKIRNNELEYIKKIRIISILNNFFWICSPIFVTTLSFGCFIFLNGGDKFTPNVAFTSITLFNIMRFPLSFLPTAISTMISVCSFKYIFLIVL